MSDCTCLSNDEVLTLIKIGDGGVTVHLGYFKNFIRIHTMTQFNFVEILNPTTNHSKVVADHSDQHFFEGYTQLVRYVPNHEVDIFEQDAVAEEDYLRHLAESADTEVDTSEDHFESTDDVYHDHRQVPIY